MELSGTFTYRLAENVKIKEWSDFTFKPEGRTAKEWHDVAFLYEMGQEVIRGERREQKCGDFNYHLEEITMFPNHDQKSQKSPRGPLPACLKRQPITWQILLLGVRFPFGLLSPMNWPTRPPSSSSGLSITLQRKDGHFGKQG